MTDRHEHRKPDGTMLTVLPSGARVHSDKPLTQETVDAIEEMVAVVLANELRKVGAPSAPHGVGEGDTVPEEDRG